LGIVGVVFVVLAAIGVGVAAYQAGEAHGLGRQIAETADGTQVVHVVDGDGDRWGHAGFFPFGFLLFPLFVIGTVLLVRAVFWRGGGPWRGGWEPGGFGPGGSESRGFGSGFWPGGTRDEWLAKAEAWHRSMHEEGKGETTDPPGREPSG
jgi:hypothetical protein